MTKKFILIGHPVGHSVSPQIHHAAYDLLGIDARYDLADCPSREAVVEQVARIVSGEVTGANVTVPHKLLAFELADKVDETALRVGVANVLAKDEAGKIVAYNTDASALADELARCQKQSGADVVARPGALVIGNGGAARAAVVACQLAGISRVAVTARSFVAKTERAAWPRADEFVSLGAELLVWPQNNTGEVSAFLKSAHLLVQATSAGMKGAPGGLELAESIPWAAFEAGIAYDLVYNPPRSPFLETAQKHGHMIEGGLGMLVGQAADAMSIWLGQKPPRDPLMSAAQRALGL